jgi:ankyrin repeat protein
MEIEALSKKADPFLCDSKKIRAFLSLLLTIYILSPNYVYATGPGAFVFVPVYLFFLIVLASGVSVIVKIIVAKASFKKWTGFPFGTLIYIAIGEAMILSFIFIPFWLSIPLDISFRMIDVLMCISDAMAIKYFQTIAADLHTFRLFAVFFITTTIYFGFAIVLNLFLVIKEKPGIWRNIGWIRKMINAGLIGLITPAVFSLLLFYPLICEIVYFDSPKYSTSTNDKNDALNESLVKATSTGNSKLVTAILNKGAEVNFRSKLTKKTALIKAASIENNLETVKLLLNKGADIHARDRGGTTALMVAASDIEIVRLLLEKGADVNAQDTRGRTALMRSARHKKLLDVTKLLFENGADVNAKGKDSETALIIASRTMANTETVKVLLQYGADVNAMDKSGVTALMNASGRNQIETVRLLIEKGADVNAKSKRGVTALMRSPYFQNIGVTKLLLEHGADVNAKGKDSETALIIASRTMANTETVKVLLQYGADANAMDRGGVTALISP